jgi:hypothetical protein
MLELQCFGKGFSPYVEDDDQVASFVFCLVYYFFNPLFPLPKRTTHPLNGQHIVELVHVGSIEWKLFGWRVNSIAFSLIVIAAEGFADAIFPNRSFPVHIDE